MHAPRLLGVDEFVCAPRAHSHSILTFFGGTFLFEALLLPPFVGFPARKEKEESVAFLGDRGAITILHRC